ncbi:MAG: glycosyltransferase [Candidatus Lokiarchaeota archaeon]|nr:glycosyltransferase [Candidatus Lokiarchaeota archaeon]
MIDDSVGLTGSGLYLYFIAKRVLQKNAEVYYLYNTKTDHIKHLNKHSNFNAIKIENRLNNNFLMLNKLSFYKSIKSNVMKLVKNDSIDLIHLNESFNPYYFYLKPIFEKFNIKSVVTAHGCVNYEAKTIISHPLVHFKEKIAHSIYYPPLIKFEIGNLIQIQNYISVTAGVKNNLIKIAKLFLNYDIKDKIIHIPNGVDTRMFSPKIKAEKYNNIKKSEDEIAIIFSGGLVVRKLPILLIKSFYLLKKYIPNVRLILIGGGRLYTECVNLITQLDLNESVNLLGYIEHADIPKVLSIADIFVLPSIYETPGISMLEAMAMKIPVIASNLPDINEIIIHEKTGLLFNNNQHAIKNLYLNLKKIIENDVLKNEIKEQAFSYIKKYYEIHKITDKIFNYYDILINS